MNERIMMLCVACGMVLAGFAMTAIGEAENAEVQALEQTQANTQMTIDNADEAVESAEESIGSVKKMGEEVEQADRAIRQATDGAEANTSTGEQIDTAMAQWMQTISPGEHHAILDSHVGSWRVNAKYWVAPGMPAQVSEGASEIKWVLDGRFIHETYECTLEFGPDTYPFKGLGMTGYDNMAGEYVSTWTDNMSTMILNSTGQYDPQTGELTLTSHYDDPMTGQPTTMRSVLRSTDPNTMRMQAYTSSAGQEYKCLDITYTRN